MLQTMDDIRVLFHERARSAFFAVYESYARHQSPTQRKGHENMFQHQASQFFTELRFKLQTIIREIIEKAKSQFDPNELNAILTQLASAYEKEFMQKVKSL
jgi:FKBP-type peptidyl-prolyl cis-trans isomerase (trigger factor)